MQLLNCIKKVINFNLRTNLYCAKLLGCPVYTLWLKLQSSILLQYTFSPNPANIHSWSMCTEKESVARALFTDSINSETKKSSSDRATQYYLSQSATGRVLQPITPQEEVGGEIGASALLPWQHSSNNFGAQRCWRKVHSFVCYVVINCLSAELMIPPFRYEKDQLPCLGAKLLFVWEDRTTSQSWASVSKRSYNSI